MIEDAWRTFKNRLVDTCPRVPDEPVVQGEKTDEPELTKEIKP